MKKIACDVKKLNPNSDWTPGVLLALKKMAVGSWKGVSGRWPLAWLFAVGWFFFCFFFGGYVVCNLWPNFYSVIFLSILPNFYRVIFSEIFTQFLHRNFFVNFTQFLQRWPLEIFCSLLEKLAVGIFGFGSITIGN